MAKIIFVLFIYFLCLPWHGSVAQVQQWETLCLLDSKLEGVSGMSSTNGGMTFWIMADNNSPPEIYEIDHNCEILRTIYADGVSKKDWEDLTSDPQGNLYIGDFGNNNNNRKDLRIYLLRNVDQLTVDSIKPEIINISYADQIAFPPAAAFRNFDMEAMVWAKDSLHLFSKNRTDPFTGYTYQYSFPAQPGNYVLSPVDSFKTGNGPMLFYWITGAAYLENPAMLALLSHDRIWLFDQFSGTQFFKGRSREIVLPNYTQKEAIYIQNPNTIYLNDEYNPTLRIGRQLYKMGVLPTFSQELEDDELLEIWPNPAENVLSILQNYFQPGQKEEFNILDLSGRCLLQFTLDQARVNLPLGSLQKGFYILSDVRGRFRKYFCKVE